MTHGQRRRRCLGGSGGIVEGVSSVSMIIGLGIVVVGVAVMGPMLFGQRQHPAPVPVRTDGARTSDPRLARSNQTAQRRPSTVASPRVSVAVRLRGIVGLLALCAGIAAALAIVVGGAVFAIGLALQR